MMFEIIPFFGLIGTTAAIVAGTVVAAGAAAAAASSGGKPKAPDYAAANREGVLADIETLPLRRMIESAAKAGEKIEYTDPRTGEKKTVDFTGLGDVDMSKQMLDWQLDSADSVAAKSLEMSQKYGADFVEQRRKELEASDPTGFKIREEMGSSILADLLAGKGLDAQTQAEVVAAERAGQAARGNIMGDSSAAAEAMAVGDAGFRLWQQKLANASAFLSGTTPTAQFGQLSGAQSGASPFAPQPVQGAATQLNPNAGAMSAQFAQQSFAQNSQNWANSPWMSLLGGISGMGIAAAGSGFGSGQAKAG